MKLLERENAEGVFNILKNPKVIENLNMNIQTSIDDSIKLIDEYYEGFKKYEKYSFEIIDKNTNITKVNEINDMIENLTKEIDNLYEEWENICESDN